MTTDLDLTKLSHAEKDALILSLVAQLQAALARIGELEKQVAELQRPPNAGQFQHAAVTQGQKPKHDGPEAERHGARTGSLGRKGWRP